MAYGLQTWDANGRDNNTGIVRVLAIGTWKVDAVQSGSASFTVPAGYTMGYLFQATQITSGSKRRRVTISGGRVTLTAVGDGDYSAGTESAIAGNYLFFAR